MNRYLEMTERLAVPDGQEERLMAAVLAAEPETAAKVYRPWSFAKKALLAAVLAVLLTATVGAAELVPWNDFFVERFGAGAADSPAAESVFQNVDVTGVCGDVALTVRQALGDEKTLYLLADYQLPEDTDMAAVRAAWEAEEGPACSVSLYSGADVSWEDIQGMDMGQVRGKLALDEVYFSGGVETVGVDADSRTLTILVTCSYEEQLSLRKPLTVLAEPPSMKWEGEWTDLADHPAVVTFRLPNTSVSRTGKAVRNDWVYTTELTPLSLYLEAEGRQQPVSGEVLRREAVLVCRDGTEVAVKELGKGGGTGSHSGGRVGKMKYGTSCTALFDTIMDPSQVKSIRIGDIVEIPLS